MALIKARVWVSSDIFPFLSRVSRLLQVSRNRQDPAVGFFSLHPSRWSASRWISASGESYFVRDALTSVQSELPSIPSGITSRMRTHPQGENSRLVKLLRELYSRTVAHLTRNNVVQRAQLATVRADPHRILRRFGFSDSVLLVGYCRFHARTRGKIMGALFPWIEGPRTASEGTATFFQEFLFLF